MKGRPRRVAGLALWVGGIVAGSVAVAGGLTVAPGWALNSGLFLMGGGLLFIGFGPIILTGRNSDAAQYRQIPAGSDVGARDAEQAASERAGTSVLASGRDFRVTAVSLLAGAAVMALGLAVGGL